MINRASNCSPSHLSLHQRPLPTGIQLLLVVLVLVISLVAHVIFRPYKHLQHNILEALEITVSCLTEYDEVTGRLATSNIPHLLSLN